MRVRLPLPFRPLSRTKATPRTTLPYGFVTEGIEDAFAEACRRLDLQPIEPTSRSILLKSCGARVEAAIGARFWLKVSGIPGGKLNLLREREEAAAAIRGVPKPDLVRILDWTADDVHWRALQMTAVQSTALSGRDFGRAVAPLGEEWFDKLKAALTTLGQVETKHWHRTPETVAQAIKHRFGKSAPGAADEWRTAHGDLYWSNLTAPELTLLDWEKWGMAPRGYDVAYLLIHSANAPHLVRRIEDVFADDLYSPSGRVARLLACAEMLNNIESGAVTPDRRPIEEMAERALHGG